MFTGAECPHCHEMDPLIERLEQEEKLKIEKLEVWHSSKNKKLQEQYDKGKCNGVPFFFNKKTNKSICGSTSYNNLKKWALVK
jgi:thiol-disulfide isomerase/thioredoxin